MFVVCLNLCYRILKTCLVDVFGHKQQFSFHIFKLLQGICEQIRIIGFQMNDPGRRQDFPVSGQEDRRGETLSLFSRLRIGESEPDGRYLAGSEDRFQVIGTGAKEYNVLKAFF